MKTITFKNRQINNYTPISNIFIEKYMPKANPAFVKIYIYLYRFYYTNTSTSLTTVSKNLDLLESDIVKSLDYWKNESLVNYDINKKNQITNLEFLDVTLFSNNDNLESKKPELKTTDYSDEEVACIVEYNPEIQELINYSQKKYCETFSANSLITIINLFDSLDLTFDIYKYIITYTETKNITNINTMVNYMKKVAISLQEKKLFKLNDVKEYLNKSYSKSNNKTITNKNKNKFLNFDEPEWDFNEIEELERKYIQNKINNINGRSE